MAGSRKSFLTKKANVITYLLAGETVASAAKLANVGERTVYRWLAGDPVFRDEQRRQTSQILDAAGWHLASMTKRACDALEYVLDHPGERGSNVKRLAAVAVLELLLKWKDTLEFNDRLTALEQQQVKK